MSTADERTVGPDGLLVVLDWRDAEAGAPAPCVLCGRPALCRSPKGVPCHKLCAELWTTRHRRPVDEAAPVDGEVPR